MSKSSDFRDGVTEPRRYFVVADRTIQEKQRMCSMKDPTSRNTCSMAPEQ